MFNGIKSIDHPVIAVRDMDAARAVYEKLGFMIPPRGSHVEWGTGNWCIMFADDYLELRGIIDAEKFTLNLDEVLDRFGEGLMGVAFGTDSAQGNYDEMQKNGLEAKPLKALRRNFELEEGWTQPSFLLCFPQEKDITGLMHVVMCEHLTPELIRKPEYLVHPNGAKRVISMTGVVEHIDQVEDAMYRLLGNKAVSRCNDSLTIDLPNEQKIHLLSKATYQENYADYSKKIGSKEQTYLGVVTLQVESINKAQALLNDNQVPFQLVNNTKVIISADNCCGVVVELME